jgi:hypothetical protein
MVDESGGMVLIRLVSGEWIIGTKAGTWISLKKPFVLARNPQNPSQVALIPYLHLMIKDDVEVYFDPTHCTNVIQQCDISQMLVNAYITASTGIQIASPNGSNRN